LADKIEDQVFALHQDLIRGHYRHGYYQSFFLCDPKKRHIHKAPVRDRLLHHAIHRLLVPIFDPTFIFDSYSSRHGKGLHKGLNRFQELAWCLSRNNTRVVWVLKCDIKKFFDSIDHIVLQKLLRAKIKDERALELMVEVVSSFEKKPGQGVPLGNLTSQLFANIYLNQLDHFVKRQLRVKNYLRYADDFVVLSRDQKELKLILLKINCFLNQKLLLQLHQRKVTIYEWHNGIDFLGYVLFPNYRILRTKTKRRMLKKLEGESQVMQAGKIDFADLNQSVQSYFGLLKHCRGREIKLKIKKLLPLV